MGFYEHHQFAYCELIDEGLVMHEHENRADPGWYPTPSGEQRYWDGSQWLALPAPEVSQIVPASGSRRLWIWGAVVTLLIVGIIVGTGSFVIADRNRARAAAEASVQAAEEASIRAAEEAAEEAASIEAAEEAAQREQDREDREERNSRRETVTEIEESISEMAEGHIAQGILDGQVISTSCSPVAGGSLEDLTEQTTVFDCFVATEDNGDGTMYGYHYHSTMNWNSGDYTYGFGAP